MNNYRKPGTHNELEKKVGSYNLKQMGLRELKSELKKQNKETLIKHISELYKKYIPVKEYFDFYINPNENELLEKYKEKVREGFFPKRGWNLKLSLARKAINEFKKLGPSQENLADLLLYYVECGVEFTNDYGDIDENFYLSLEKTYVQALTLMRKENILEKFAERAKEIVNDTSNIGWGFHDCLIQVCFDFYQDDYEEEDKESEKEK